MMRLLKKINTNQGASLSIALVLFLFCIMIGGSIIAAASANADVTAIKKTKNERQAYLAMTSAVDLVKKKLKSSGSLSFSAGSPPPANIDYLLNYRNDSSYSILTTGTADDKEYIINFDDISDDYDITMTLSMTSDYMILVKLNFPDGSPYAGLYPMKMTIEAEEDIDEGVTTVSWDSGECIVSELSDGADDDD